ncbi:MAG: response regulator [Rhodoferax sp.]|nr:response regulator [Rhodoferax sp.]
MNNSIDNGQGSIVIVDDNPNNLQVLSGILQQAGFKARPALSGEIALRAIAASAPDLVLLDIRMPGMDGTLNVVWNELKYKAEVIKEYAGIPDIKCIPSQLYQVFMNLLINAAQAIDKHGRTTVRTGQEDQMVRVEVRDTSRGKLAILKKVCVC